MSVRDWLLVSETFKTVQGEGPSVGTPAYFVRLGACNLSCKWCNTPYTWSFGERAQDHESKVPYSATEELNRIGIYSLAQRIRDARAPLCVITGGEPLLQVLAVDQLISQVNEEPTPRSRVRFEIETAGTLEPGELAIYDNVALNVSPKLASSGNDIRKRYRPDVLTQMNLSWGSRARFKFVPDSRRGYTESLSRDITEIEKITRECRIPESRVWLMPCGTTANELDTGLEVLAPIAIAHGWNVTDRLHIRIWRNKRGH